MIDIVHSPTTLPELCSHPTLTAFPNDGDFMGASYMPLLLPILPILPSSLDIAHSPTALEEPCNHPELAGLLHDKDSMGASNIALLPSSFKSSPRPSTPRAKTALTILPLLTYHHVQLRASQGNPSHPLSPYEDMSSPSCLLQLLPLSRTLEM